MKLILMFLFFFTNALVFYFIRQINENHTSHMTIYEAPSGAKVFSSGTIQWSWGLDDYNVPALRSSRYNKNAEIITENILFFLGAEKK